MIKYALQCENGHQFDGWFSSSDSFDAQKAQGLLTCVVCGTGNIEKMLMAPNVTGTKHKGVDQPVMEAPQPETPSSLPAVHPTPPAVTQAAVPQILPPKEAMVEIVEKIREVRRFVEESHEDVGDRFAEEARKIHYGEEEARGIFGESTLEETVELLEEGIEVLPLPRLPEENN